LARVDGDAAPDSVFAALVAAIDGSA